MVFGHAGAQLIFLLLYHTSYLGPLLPSTLGSYQGLIAASSAVRPPSAGCTASSEEIEEWREKPKRAASNMQGVQIKTRREGKRTNK